LRYAARAGHRPDIVCKKESDLRLVKRGIAQQQWSSGHSLAAEEHRREKSSDTRQGRNAAQAMRNRYYMQFHLQDL
jgi:hypothetical protein